MSTADLDKSGSWQQTTRVYFGPTLGNLTVINEPTDVTTTPYTIAAYLLQQSIINIGAFNVNVAGPVTINLPPAAGRLNYPIVIFDVSGNAFTNNITIVPNGAETIMGLASIALATNYGSYSLYPIITGGWNVP